MFCPNCGKQNDDRAMYCQSCGTTLGAKPAVAAMAGIGSVSSVQAGTYAGFWIRFVAWIIDAVIVSVGIGILTTMTMGAGIVLSFFGHWLYEALMLSPAWEATVGK